MRYWVVLLLASFAVAAPATAREMFTSDGQYSICPYLELRNCELLTDDMKESGRFTPDETQKLRTLKSITDRARTVTRPELEKIFGQTPYMLEMPGPGAEKAFGISWLTDPKGECPICGVQMIFTKIGLTTVQYSVYNKFFIGWSTADR